MNFSKRLQRPTHSSAASHRDLQRARNAADAVAPQHPGGLSVAAHAKENEVPRPTDRRIHRASA